MSNKKIEEAETVEEAWDLSIRTVIAETSQFFRTTSERKASTHVNKFKSRVHEVRAQLTNVTELDPAQFLDVLVEELSPEKFGKSKNPKKPNILIFNEGLTKIIIETRARLEKVVRELRGKKTGTDSSSQRALHSDFSSLGIKEKILLLPETVSRIFIDYLAALELKDYDQAQELLARAVEELIKENETDIKKLIEEKEAADQLVEEAEEAMSQLKEELEVTQNHLAAARAGLQDFETTKESLRVATEKLAEIEAKKEGFVITTEQSRELEDRIQALDLRADAAEKSQRETQLQCEDSERQRQQLSGQLGCIQADLERSREIIRRLEGEKKEIALTSGNFERLLNEVRARLNTISEENNRLKQENVRLRQKTEVLKTPTPQPHRVLDASKELEALAEVGVLIGAAREKLQGIQDFSQRLEQVAEIRRLVQVEIDEAHTQIETLQRQVAELQTRNGTLEETLKKKDAEIASLQDKLRLASVTPTIPSSSERLDVTVEIAEAARTPNLFLKKQLRARLTELEEKIGSIDPLVMEIVAWLQDIKERKEREFMKLKLTAEGQTLFILEEKEKQVDIQIAAIEKRHTELQTLFAQLETVKRDTTEYLRALELVEKGPPAVNVALQQFEMKDFHPPTFEELTADLQVFLPEVPREDKSPGDIDLAEKITIEGLPFAVEFTPAQCQQIRQCEALLESVKGRDLTEIRIAFPYNASGDKEKYYDGFLETLRNGTFLPNLKMAIAILGALRSDNEFKGRISRTLSLVMKINTVKIALAFGPETKAVTWALVQANILSSIHQALSFIRRTSIGNQFGQLNELTPLGQTASQVWTKDLLEANIINKAQLSGLHAYVQDKDE